MSTVVIVGGGISGLSAAYYVTKQFTKPQIQKIILLEGSKRLGGWIQTTKTEHGAIFEHGPRTFRPAGKTGKNTLQLVEELGLTESVMGIPRSSEAARNRYIYKNGEVNRLGLFSMLLGLPPFTKSVLSPNLKEIFNLTPVPVDESIYSFMKRRLGKDFTDVAVNPMFRGIFAGDIKKLSIRSCLPDFYHGVKRHRTLIKFMLKQRKDTTEYNSPLIKQALSQHWAMWSLRGGLQELTTALEDKLSQTNRVQIQLDSSCKKLTFDGNKVQVQTDKEEIKADHVICSTLSTVLSDCLPPEHQALKDQLDKIRAVSCVVVNVEYGGKIPIKTGFGHLVPSSEDGPVLGVIYDSCCLQVHDRPGQPTTRFTVMLGGAWFDELNYRVGRLDKDALSKLAVDTLSQHLNITVQPIWTHVAIQENCIPQYEVGHHAILDNIFDYIYMKGLRLSLVGSSYEGVSLNDCIYNSKMEAERLTKCFQWA